MTDIIEDNVEIVLEIDDLPWNLIDAEVVLSQVASPNYVDMIITPEPQILQELPESKNIAEIVGSDFLLEANNNLITERDTDAEEDSLLFSGKLANISSIGENAYEAIAYDPGQQAFNIGAESGSIINQKYDFRNASFVEPETKVDPDESKDKTYSKKAEVIMQDILSEVGIVNSEINLQEGGITRTSEDGERSITGAYNVEIEFDSAVVTVKDILDRLREMCRAEWWFDKSGTFKFGLPEPTKHEISLIKDTSAGITTPPYQSVEVVGEGVASSEGWAANQTFQDEDSKLVKRAVLARRSATLADTEQTSEDEDQEVTVGAQSETIVILDPTREQFFQNKPAFQYVNAEISTDEQAQNTALKIADELAKQQASGTITTVGFPEVVPFDGLVMPQASNPDGSNYNPNQPMGGFTYSVYSVKHRLNPSDGFITKIEVAGATDLTQTVALPEKNAIATSVDRDVFTNDGKRRAFKPGAGKGE